MKIALEATGAYSEGRGGIARYTLELAFALERLLRERDDDSSLDLLYRLSRCWGKQGSRPAVPGTRYRWIQEPLWPPLSSYDVVHGTDARVPSGGRGATVATLHDVFSMVSDEYGSEKFRNLKRQRYQRLADTCDRIIAVSQATKEDYLRYFDYPRAQIDVVPEGVGPRFRRLPGDDLRAACIRHGLDEPFVLFIGELSRRKNLPNMIRAFSRSALAEHCVLALGGKQAWGFDEVKRAIDRAGVGSRVRLLGYIPDSDLPALYGAAEVFFYVTCYEGFGLPILESMACGTPVVVGNVGAAPEVAGGHASMADPDDIDAIANALNEAWAVRPAEVERAGEYASTFTWDACARATLEVYHRAVRTH